MNQWRRVLLALAVCGLVGYLPAGSASLANPAEGFLDTLTRDTWDYLHSDQTTVHHLPYSWWSASLPGGDYANPAEIGLYALSWLAAYDLARPWSPSWAATEAELHAVLDQLRAWQTGSQAYQPHGPNAYQNSVFYQWYWISWNPPVVGADAGLNQLAPSVDNAWLAASLITIREYASAHGHSALAAKCTAILADMDFTLWYHPDTHRFSWGDVQDPQGGAQADYYSNENRIINFVARALGQLGAAEFRMSLDALEGPSGAYGDIVVDKMAYDGSYFTYAAPALFIREMSTAYGRTTITPATQAQIAYAADRGYPVWGLSDCFDVEAGGYVQQGAPPAPDGVNPETRPGLVTPHASGLALITPLAADALTNLQAMTALFTCAYDPTYGFRDSVMADPSASDYGQCSDRFSALAQEWLFLALVNHESSFIWRYFYRDSGVLRAHTEMYGGAVYLPLVLR